MLPVPPSLSSPPLPPPAFFLLLCGRKGEGGLVSFSSLLVQRSLSRTLRHTGTSIPFTLFLRFSLFFLSLSLSLHGIETVILLAFSRPKEAFLTGPRSLSLSVVSAMAERQPHGAPDADERKCVVPSADSPSTRKRSRSSPPYPPFVEDYRPYTGGQLRRVYEKKRDEHKLHWDLYYRNNTLNGYKDRHYILREFEELRATLEVAERANHEEQQRNQVTVPVRTNGDSESRAESASGACLASPSPPDGQSVSSFAWLEAGCGVGNAMLPIFEQYGHLPAWRALLGFDISSVAIALLEEKKKKELPPELAAKVHVCVLDPCEQEVVDCPFFELPPPMHGVPRLPLNPVEFTSMVFVLCSIPVAQHVQVLRRVAQCMKRPGGVFFFRDYAVSDHAETRFRLRDGAGPAQTVPFASGAPGSHEELQPMADEERVAGNTYARTNGTLSHFFSEEEVRGLFEAAGFTVRHLEIVSRVVENRKTNVSFTRKFVQGRFALT